MRSSHHLGAIVVAVVAVVRDVVHVASGCLVCVCVCVCVGVGVGTCVCACVCVCVHGGGISE